jgi:hypothetical protein
MNATDLAKRAVVVGLRLVRAAPAVSPPTSAVTAGYALPNLRTVHCADLASVVTDATSKYSDYIINN